jgi:AtzH-like
LSSRIPESAAAPVNLPAVVAEVAEAFERYERALVADDVDALTEAFWDSELAVRFGVAECQYGSNAIMSWRRSAPPLPPGRSIGPTRVVTFGHDVASVTTEFRYPGDTSLGRQSQTWVRRPEGWRIVSAHVSMLPD